MAHKKAGGSSRTEILNKEFPIGSDAMTSLAGLVAKGVADKSLCDREGGPGVTYSSRQGYWKV